MYKRQVLDSFIPGRRLDQLRLKLFYRVQANGEELTDFVQSVRKAARILRLGLPETEVIQVILEGPTPQERSCVVLTRASSG